ncbi:MAG: hypothetical protein CV087_20450 [Candidatus Brocadia sp. WS118]|nr:MAG: hypothetical protein CV087_20450 [Candidatus Brocadia sp. WS118]
MYRHETLEKYVEDAAMGTPTPGGGSVAALVGALATTMCSMSANLTVGKEEFKQHDIQLKEILEECKKSRETLLSLMEEDISVYREVSRAYVLPKSSGSERNRRSEAIQKTTILAMVVPLKTMMCCLYVLKKTRELVDIANPNLISDLGVACYLANAAFRCAKLNVEINLAAMKNHELVKKVHGELSYAGKLARVFYEETKERVQRKLER